MSAAVAGYLVAGDASFVVDAGEVGGVGVLNTVIDVVIGRNKEKGVAVEFRPVIADNPAVGINPETVGAGRLGTGVLDAGGDGAIGRADVAVGKGIAGETVGAGDHPVGADGLRCAARSGDAEIDRDNGAAAIQIGQVTGACRIVVADKVAVVIEAENSCIESAGNVEG